MCLILLEPSNFTDLLLGSKNEFYKNHGKSENQTFFKSSKQGSNGDYNTYKYESRFFFRTIGDIEEFFPTSGSYLKIELVQTPNNLLIIMITLDILEIVIM